MSCRSLVANTVKIALVGSACMAGLPAAWAQASAPAQASVPADESTTPGPARSAPEPELQEVLVTGYRKSLSEATEAKRESTGFVDSIFAEDIGKFPDTNIAESFNRVPGITIVRDVTGEGVNVAIRGLGVNFTKVTLNGAPVAVASSGRTDAVNTNREVDLDMFPTELFTQLTVRKSSSASMLEGGAAGTVDMRSARPFDNPGQHVTFSVQATDNTNADGWGERGSLLASKTWGDSFGVLVGAAAVRNSVRVTGFETVGSTNPNLTPAQCGSNYTTCNSTGGGNWTIPSTVPANAGNGLNPGDTIDNAFLLAHNPGLSIQQIDNAILPRIGRPMDEFGTKKRYNGILSVEFRPTDDLRLYVDSLYGKRENDQVRTDMNWIIRSGAVIPLNEQVDKSDCSAGCTVTSGTYANSRFFLEYRPWVEDVNYWGANPGLTWQIADQWKLDLQANKTRSTFHRESPSVLVATAPQSGTTVNFVNGEIPSITSNADLNDPANFYWNDATRINVQDEKRQTDTKGIRGNLTFGNGGPFNISVGGAYDDVSRQITPYDNSQAAQNAICGGNPNVYLPSPNTQPPCQGLTGPGAGYPTYPGLGSGYSAGITTPLVYQGSLIPASALQSYLHPGRDGFITLDWSRFARDAQYAAFHNSQIAVAGANTGANGGAVEEKTTGIYTELSGETTVGGNRLRYTAGVRWVHTRQAIGGFVYLPDPRNTVLNANGTPQTIADGARYPNTVNFVYTANSYNNTLPSAELAYNVAENALVRVAASKTMTRPDPNAMLPGLSFPSVSADIATLGNPALKPFISENVDLGFEYYTGKEGYVGMAAFRKRLTGFTSNGNTTVPFAALAPYGVTYDTISPSQQAALDARGGPNAATIVLTQQVNSSGALTVNGLEFNWVQPLDFLLGRIGLEGFGFQANFTLIDQFGTGAAPAVALGVAPHTYNVTAYYDHGPFTARLSTVFNKGSQITTANQNGITAAAIFNDDYTQWDFSSSVDLSKLFGWKNELQLTLDGINLFNAKQRTYFQFSNVTSSQYTPGRTYLLGLRGRF